MGFFAAIKTCFRKYVSISGRAPRSEYWWFTLFLILLGLVAVGLDALIFGIEMLDSDSGGPIENIVNLATFVPSLTVAIRRLHDINLSGFYLIIPIVMSVVGVFLAFTAPFELASAGFIIIALFIIAAMLLYLWWMIKPSDPGPNRFGPNPFDKTAEIEEVFE